MIGANVTVLGAESFRYCYSLATVTIPDGVVFIGDRVFRYCTGLTNAIIGTNAVDIGAEAFYHCESLANLVIGNQIANIGDYAFDSCLSLTDVVVPDCVTNIGYAAFYNCTGLTDVTLGTGVASIGYFSFDCCSRLSSITVNELNPFYSSEEGVLSNKSRTALVLCPRGKAGEYDIPVGITNIGIRAFSTCTGLTRVTFPSSLINIGDCAFYNCTRLTSVTIPAGVTSIGDGAFYASDPGADGGGLVIIVVGPTPPNTNLAEVYFLGDAPSIGSDAFYGANAVIHYLQGTAGWDATFGGCPTVPWLPQIRHRSATEGFGFDMNWAEGQTVVVEACTNLAGGVWEPLQTNVLTTGSAQFNDPKWANFPGRFYRLRSL